MLDESFVEPNNDLVKNNLMLRNASSKVKMAIQKLATEFRNNRCAKRISQLREEGEVYLIPS
jgi:hypothetical protein